MQRHHADPLSTEILNHPSDVSQYLRHNMLEMKLLAMLPNLTSEGIAGYFERLIRSLFS